MRYFWITAGLVRREQCGDVSTVVLSCRALVYGLVRMYVDGHFPEWQSEGEPAVWMERALSDFIQRLRKDCG